MVSTDTSTNLIVYLVDPQGNIRRPTVPHWNGGEINPIHYWNGGHWEHDYDEEDGLDYIDTTFFVKNDRGSYDKYTEGYEKRIFTYREIDEAARARGLSVKLVYENSELAGRRYFYE